jgi:hypothetical protein
VIRLLCAALCALTLAGCEVYRPATPEAIAAARYESDAPASVALISMVNARNGRSAHSALLINGSQQVLYDPAGTFTHPDLPRAGDIHYGMSPRFVDYYERYHARFSHFVHVQQVEVDRATADELIARAQAEGKTAKMHCALAVAAVLQPVRPFGATRSSYFPEVLREDFERLPGVRERFVYDSDTGKTKVWEQSSAGPAT